MTQLRESVQQNGTTQQMTMIQAINDGMRLMLEEDDLNKKHRDGLINLGKPTRVRHRHLKLVGARRAVKLKV